MSNPRRLLVDTSALIDPPSEKEERSHRLGEADWAISTITIAELHKGVLLASGGAARAGRVRRLANIEARFEALPLDTDVARVLGRYMAEAKRSPGPLRVRDAIIAATAAAKELAVLTRDADFGRFGAELVLLQGAESGG